MKKVFQIGLLLYIFACLAAAQDLTVSSIMAEPSIAGMRVEGERLSPDRRYVVYLWNSEGIEPRDLYLVSTTGGEPKKILSKKDLPDKPDEREKENKLDYGLIVRDDFAKARENQIGNLAWSPDSQRILFTHKGDLFILKIGETTPKRITQTQSPEVGARWLDDKRILFQQSGNLFVINIAETQLIQISKEANPAQQILVSGANASKNGQMIAYTVSDGSKQRALFVPSYIDEFTSAPSVRRGWTEQKVLAASTDGSSEKSIEIKLPKAEGESYFAGLHWLADNRTLLINRIDKTTKRRQLFLAKDLEKEPKVFLITEETDEKWNAPLSGIIEPNPTDAKQLFFASERDGWNHLYLVTLDEKKFADGKTNAEIVQLTKGNFEINWAKWLGETGQIGYLSTEINPATRDFFLINPRTLAKTDLLDLPKGMKTSLQFESESNKGILLFERSQWSIPGDLFVYPICLDCKIVNRNQVSYKLTKTTPESFFEYKWNEPKFIEIDSRDNKKIPAKIYLPENFSKTKKYPLVVFVHGAGYLQNVINGWNNYYREFMFNQHLTRKGYVVLDIDYRGSAGYGRDWRTDVYDFLGGKDYEDHLDSIDYMVENYSVDEKRVGVYGGSYGGFMAAMLVMRAPEKIAAAAALRPVMDWKNYYAANPVYTAQRLGIPKDNAEAYKRSSPISYAENLQKPLLILHGLVDSNVHAQDSIQMIEKLIRLKKTKYFEAMLYPAENHAFTRPTSWEDEYERILAFFEKHLK